jgi:hypothetical protein
MKLYKNRIINYQEPVRVYRNLSKTIKEAYSIQQNGLVVAHTDLLELRNCEFIINKNGQERVRREKKKYVHAFVVGIPKVKLPTHAKLKYKIKYNPYKDDTFVAVADDEELPVSGAEVIRINRYGVTAAHIEEIYE